MEIAKENDEITEEKLLYLRQMEDLKRRINELEFEIKDIINDNNELKQKNRQNFDKSTKQIDELKKKIFDGGVLNDNLRREKHEVEFFLHQADSDKEKVFNTIKTLTQVRYNLYITF